MVARSWDSFSDYEDLSPSCAQCEDDGGSNDELDGDFFEDNLTSDGMLNEGIKRDYKKFIEHFSVGTSFILLTVGNHR